MIDPALIERWLAARDHVSIRAAWTALPATLHALGSPHRKPTLHGAAVLAGAMLGERADWLLERTAGSPATFSVTRISEGAFLDHVWSVNEPNQEALAIYERRDGLRGVQLISISSGTITGRPEGGGVNAVRVFDRDRAVSIPIDSYDAIPKVAVIGEVDLAPLDLFAYSRSFTLTTGGCDVETARAVIAQLAAEVDAHYDTSTLWAEGPASPERAIWYLPDTTSVQTFRDGDRAVAIANDRSGPIWAQVHGLPWGQQLAIRIGSRLDGDLVMRFSNADLDRIEARLAAIGRLN